MSYNTATAQAGGVQLPRAGADTVLQAIGLESVNSVAKPIDVLLLQEQFSVTTSTQAFVDLLNGVYGAGVYARSTVNSDVTSLTRDGGGPAMIYNTQTVQLVQEGTLGGTGSSAAAREPQLYRIRPQGYDESADFLVINSHYKAGSTTTDKNRRQEEAKRTRFYGDLFAANTPLIYAGDFNIQSSSEAMYQTLLSSGPGQAFDPINSPGSWNSNSAFKSIHTQSPRGFSGSNGLIGGGVDDRFDFQLVTGELLDNEGLSIIPNSYHAFGNNGTHACCNSSITSGTGASSTVLSALTTASDHLPVVADYQLPAIQEVLTAEVPATLELGEAFSLEVMVRNAANVLASIGADELDYTLSVSGDLSGSGSGSLLALAPADSYQVLFDTSSLGQKSGLLSVSTTSQGAAGAMFELPISYEVLSTTLPGDFNGDDRVDAADYAVWRNGYSDGGYTSEDYTLWRHSYGMLVMTPDATTAVPAPTAGGLCLVTLVLFAPLSTRQQRPAKNVNIALISGNNSGIALSGW